MVEANVIFNLDGIDLKIQCTIDDKMEYICEKYSNKIYKEINALIFIYERSQVNFELKFKEQANHHDLKDKKMNILVYNFICPKYKLNNKKLDEIILTNNENIESISGIKFQIVNIIKTTTDNQIKSQLKNINDLLNMINNNIKNNNEKINNLFSHYNNYNKINNHNKINYNNTKININNINCKTNDVYEKIFSYVNEKKKNKIN